MTCCIVNRLLVSSFMDPCSVVLTFGGLQPSIVMKKYFVNTRYVYNIIGTYVLLCLYSV